MKYTMIITLLLLIAHDTSSQSIVSSADSKSGILVGSDTDFAGINYENGNDEFSFNYKFNRQDSTIVEGNDYPNLFGINIRAGITTAKGRGSIVSDEKWSGGLRMDITFLRTWDKSSKSKLEGETAESGLSQYSKDNITESTLYIKFSESIDRLNVFESTSSSIDTTFVSFEDPMQSTFTVSPGFYSMKQWGSKWFFSWALSANINFINRSVKKLAKTNLMANNGLVYSSKDSTAIQKVEESKTFYAGSPESEVFFVPRADLFFRYRLGPQKPVPGLIFAFSPLISSFTEVDNRNSFSFGPTIGLDRFPDQVLFAILNEFIQGKDGEYKYGLTFQASFPILFK